jgi:RNA polymerase sigma-70 factor (ECF subfamily)
MDKRQVDVKDERFILELRAGSSKAFALLFDRYAGQIYRFASKFGLGHEDAEGIIQDVFLKLWEKKETLDYQRNLNAYLYKIAKSYCIKQKKKLLLEKVFVLLETEGSALADPLELENGLIVQDFIALIYRWSARLPKGQRKVFELRNKEQLTIDEIAVRLKIPKRKVENRMYQANKTLRSKLATDKLLVWTGISFIDFL